MAAVRRRAEKRVQWVGEVSSAGRHVRNVLSLQIDDESGMPWVGAAGLVIYYSCSALSS